MELMDLLEYTDSDGQSKDFRLLEKIQNDWKTIGIQMGIEYATLESFEHKEGGAYEQCHKVFHKWLSMGSKKYPVTWSGLMRLLEAVQLREVSCELQEALGEMIWYTQ